MKVKFVEFNAKCSDLSDMYLLDKEGNILKEHEGYVPRCSLGGGDYVKFIVNNETGQILEWHPIDVEDLDG